MNTREKLICVAGDMFAKNGFDGVSVRAIVARARANLGAVTYHFGSKEGLFGEVVARKAAPLREIGEKIQRSKRGPAEKLRDILEAYAMYVMHDDPGMKVLFAETLMGGDRLPTVARELVAWRNEMAGELIRDGIRQGIFRDCDVEATVWIFFGMLTPYLLYQPLMPKGIRHGAYSKAYVRRVVRAALEVFMDGLFVKPGPSGTWMARRKKT